jgi:hypothetical protein
MPDETEYSDVLDRLERIDAVRDKTSRLLALRDQAVALKESIAEVEQELVDLMETDDRVEVPGIGTLIRYPKKRYGWAEGVDREKFLEDVRNAIVREVAIDPDTGEVRPLARRTVEQTFAVIEQSLSISGDPKKGFRTLLHLQPDEYRAVTGAYYELKVAQHEDGSDV